MGSRSVFPVKGKDPAGEGVVCPTGMGRYARARWNTFAVYNYYNGSPMGRTFHSLGPGLLVLEAQNAPEKLFLFSLAFQLWPDCPGTIQITAYFSRSLGGLE